MAKGVNAQTLKEWLASNQAILIDVREVDEFADEHIGAASWIPLKRLESDISKLIDIIGGKKVVFQCKAGKRGEQACSIAYDFGDGVEVFNLEGGIEGWKQAGFPTIVRGKTSLSIFRQVQIGVGLLILLCVALGFMISFAFFYAVAFFGAALIFAGFTGWCGLAMLLSKMPWNR